MKRFALGSFFAFVVAVSPATALADAPDAAVLEQGKTLFMSGATPACAICHTLKDAGATGSIGPDLDQLKADVDRIKKVLVEGLGAMPSFADTLSEEQRNAVAAYVVHVTAAGN